MEAPILEVGQEIWRVNNKGKVYSSLVKKKEWSDFRRDYYYEDESYRSCSGRTFGRFWFLDQESAEKEAERYRKIDTKRILLLEYEEKLNEMLGLDDHFIVRKNKED